MYCINVVHQYTLCTFKCAQVCAICMAASLLRLSNSMQSRFVTTRPSLRLQMNFCAPVQPSARATACLLGAVDASFWRRSTASSHSAATEADAAVSGNAAPFSAERSDSTRRANRITRATGARSERHSLEGVELRRAALPARRSLLTLQLEASGQRSTVSRSTSVSSQAGTATGGSPVACQQRTGSCCAGSHDQESPGVASGCPLRLPPAPEERSHSAEVALAPPLSAVVRGGGVCMDSAAAPPRVSAPPLIHQADRLIAESQQTACTLQPAANAQALSVSSESSSAVHIVPPQRMPATPCAADALDMSRSCSASPDAAAAQVLRVQLHLARLQAARAASGACSDELSQYCDAHKRQCDNSVKLPSIDASLGLHTLSTNTDSTSDEHRAG